MNRVEFWGMEKEDGSLMEGFHIGLPKFMESRKDAIEFIRLYLPKNAIIKPVRLLITIKKEI